MPQSAFFSPYYSIRISFSAAVAAGAQEAKDADELFERLTLEAEQRKTLEEGEGSAHGLVGLVRRQRAPGL